KKYVVNDLLQVGIILQKYSQKKQLSRTEITELELITCKKSNTIHTLNELLKEQIIDLINLGYEFCKEESSVDFGLKSSIFLSDDVSLSLEDDLLAKIIMLLECYDGKRCFYVHTKFNDGVGIISILA
ncbi:hypothetical protein LJC58_10350, partial [Lachnospiraceae bacterium OttesenSCG-928-D06]|nr:hypothetical protein [Lachnospiraceae bacterium OttesenSCG-928-D06]